MRIFLGPCWYGRIAATLGSALKERGLRATVAARAGASTRYPDAEYDETVDFEGLPKWQILFKMLWFFLRVLRRHDVFIFLYGDTLLPWNLDLPILKLLRKKVVVWFIGSDIRDYKLFLQEAKTSRIVHHINPCLMRRAENSEAQRRRLRMIRMVEKYADCIVSYPSISHRLARDYWMVFVPVDVRSIRYNNKPNTRPTVVHAPTNDETKGTSHILKAVERLSSESYDFDFRLLRSVSNHEVRETLSEADIAVDQLYATSGGVFAIESMAAGCAVLGGNIPELSHYSRELPILHTDPDNVYDKLKMLLENPELRRELGEKGRKYVEEYHDSRKIADQILQLLSGNTEGIPLIAPDRASL